MLFKKTIEVLETSSVWTVESTKESKLINMLFKKTIEVLETSSV